MKTPLQYAGRLHRFKLGMIEVRVSTAGVLHRGQRTGVNRRGWNAASSSSRLNPSRLPIPNPDLLPPHHPPPPQRMPRAAPDPPPRASAFAAHEPHLRKPPPLDPPISPPRD